jgi:hypothetical protein
MFDLGATFKAGDQGGRDKRHGWKDGDLVSIDDMDCPSWGKRRHTALRDVHSEDMKRIFPIAYIRSADRILLRRMEQERRSIRLKALASAANDPNLVKRWRSRTDVVEPVKLTRRLRESDFYLSRDEVLSRLPILDVNAVSQGSYLVGSGETYTSHKAAQADIAATLTNDLTFTSTSATSESTGFSYFEPDLASYTLTFTADSDHAGLLTGGNKASMTGTGYLFRFRTTGSSGKLVIKLMNIFSSTDTQAAAIQCDSISSGNDVELHNTIMDLDSGCNAGIDLDAPNVDFLIWLIGIIDSNSQGIDVEAAGSGTRIENCTIRNPAAGSGDGVDLNADAVRCRNVAVEGFPSDDDFRDIGSSDGYNNASGNGSAHDSNWSTGSGNLTGQGSGQYSDSTWQVGSMSNLTGAGSAPDIGTNAADIKGTSYGGVYPIGCWKAAGDGPNQYGAVAFAHEA